MGFLRVNRCLCCLCSKPRHPFLCDWESAPDASQRDSSTPPSSVEHMHAKRRRTVCVLLPGVCQTPYLKFSDRRGIEVASCLEEFPICDYHALLRRDSSFSRASSLGAPADNVMVHVLYVFYYHFTYASENHKTSMIIQLHMQLVCLFQLHI